MNENKKVKNGFTLMEILVAMGIVAVLSAVSLFALRGARESGRDARRKGDLQSMANGFEIYKSDCKYYPASQPAVASTLDGADAPCPTTCTTCGTNVYIQSVQDDPDTNKNYYYQPVMVAGNAVQYRIWAALESQPTPSLGGPCPGPAVSCGSTNCNYCVTNP